MDEQSRELSCFQADIEGFSGPFDLLCYLVENRQLEAARISVGQVVRIYGAYLANTGKVSVAVVSEFLSMASSLVLNKIRSLFPQRETGEEDSDYSIIDEGANVEEKLSRYRPYRLAAAFLAKCRERQDKMFARESEEIEEPSWGLGDLFGLCNIWWDLLEAHRGTAGKGKISLFDDGMYMEGVPAPLPDEAQIEKKISEIMAGLEGKQRVSLSTLLGENRTAAAFVVTVLSLLEMSRMGYIKLYQEVLFQDVLICPL